MTNIVLSYEDAREAGPRSAGGKGWNLGRLHHFGFPVPRGGVIAADVYRQVIFDTKVARQVAELGGVTAESVETPEVAGRLEEIRSRIVAATLADDVRNAVREFLESLRIADVPVAVRSSATAEDGAHTSFAGIHESQLNVVGLDAVIQAVLECYASLWTTRAVAYRGRFDLRDDDVACAVVICEMVRGPNGAPVAAGVAFSCDPVTGRRDVVQLSAVSGLGDALVSGAVNAEEWTFISEQFQMIVERPDWAVDAHASMG